MRSKWGLAVGPHIWPWPLAGQLGPYNLGSDSPLWPGERTHTYTHQTQRQQQQDPTSTTWTMRSNKAEWKLQPVTVSRSYSGAGRKSWWSTHAATHAHTVHMCAAELKLVTFRSSACARKSRGGKDSERGRERRRCGQEACLHCTSPSSITLNRKVIDYETRAGRGWAVQWLLLACRRPLTC